MPGYPCCCEGCIWINDDFAVDSLASYSQKFGAWSWSAGQISTAANNARILHNTANPAGNSHMIGLANFSLDQNEGAGVMISSDAANSNYLYGLFRRTGNTAGNLKIFQVAGGVATQLAHTVSGGFSSTRNFQMRLCYDGAELTGSVPLLVGATPADLQIAAPLVGWNSAYQQAGLRTDANGGATVEFTNFLVSKHQVDDASCEDCVLFCPTCTGEARSTMQLSITGLTNAAGSQCICNQWNGTYIVKRQQDVGGVIDGPCGTAWQPPLDACYWVGDWIPLSQPYCAFFRYRAIVKYQRGTRPGGGIEHAILARLEGDSGIGTPYPVLAEAFYQMPNPADPPPCEHAGLVLTNCGPTADCTTAGSVWTLTSL